MIVTCIQHTGHRPKAEAFLLILLFVVVEWNNHPVLVESKADHEEDDYRYIKLQDVA
mgnify:CR=1 FL=1